ncbi:MAG: carboxymuconolactone decarboxylase family protein, partial [Pseudomonadota bacterium]
ADPRHGRRPAPLRSASRRPWRRRRRCPNIKPGPLDGGRSLAQGEAARQRAFSGNAFDDKTTQLILLAILASQGSPAVKWHIKAARNAGARNAEIIDAIELAGSVATLGVLNTAYAVLDDLDREEKAASLTQNDQPRQSPKGEER